MKTYEIYEDGDIVEEDLKSLEEVKKIIDEDIKFVNSNNGTELNYSSYTIRVIEQLKFSELLENKS